MSSVKELVRRWYPTVRAQRPRKAGSHRALDDIRESVAELRYYRERVFVSPAAVAPPRDDSGPATNGPEPGDIIVLPGSESSDPSTAPAAEAP